jgi:hypothetical protein
MMRLERLFRSLFARRNDAIPRHWVKTHQTFVNHESISRFSYSEQAKASHLMGRKDDTPQSVHWVDGSEEENAQFCVEPRTDANR